ncbi:MAG: hypothetical protein ACI9FB_002394 [Candidatus Azotimanducaceae bacterium]|jgi:hypothetical protein
MSKIKCITISTFVVLIGWFFSAGAYAEKYGMSGNGKATCGDLVNDQALCGTGPATFESNAVGECPSGSFADVGTWGCYQCPIGFDRGVAHVDSDRACTKTARGLPKPRFKKSDYIKTVCPSGSFFDPIRGGECWSCPKGYTRSIAHVEWPDACVKLAGEDVKKVTEHSKGTGIFGTDCPRSQFWDGVDGKCHSCPSGYNRSWNHVHSAAACSKYVAGSQRKATIQGVAECPDGSFGDFLMDPEKGGKCYACAAGYDRTLFERVDSHKACETSPELDFSEAIKVTGLSCAAGTMFDFISTNDSNVRKKLREDGVPSDSYDSDNDGTCWSCPPGATRSWSAVYADDACVLADVGWTLPPFRAPGLVGMLGTSYYGAMKELLTNPLHIALVARIIGSFADNVDQSALKENYPQSTDPALEFKRDMWRTIRDTPEKSPALALALFTAMLEERNKGGWTVNRNTAMFKAASEFEKYVTQYRIDMAEEALAIYDVWASGAAQRYFDPRFMNRPEVAAAKIAWASIGVFSPPVSPPDFGSLVYEIEEPPELDSLSLEMAALEVGVDKGTLQRLMPSNISGDVIKKVNDSIRERITGSLEAKIMKQIEKRLLKEALKQGGTTAAKASLLGVSMVGPQIAMAVFIEFASQWTDFLAASIDARPKLRAELAQAEQGYRLNEETKTAEGYLAAKSYYKMLMNSDVKPRSGDVANIAGILYTPQVLVHIAPLLPLD